MFTVEERDRVRDTILKMARADPRVVAGAMIGSLALGAIPGRTLTSASAWRTERPPATYLRGGHRSSSESVARFISSTCRRCPPFTASSYFLGVCRSTCQ